MRLLLNLALLSAITGCVSAPPKAPHAEFRQGIAPVAPPVPYTGEYILHSSGKSLAVQHAEKGQPVGFVREKDGSVTAIAPDFVLPLGPGSYAWIAENEPVPAWRVRFRERVFDGTRRVGNVLLVVTVIAVGLAFAVAYGMASKPIGY